MLKVNYDNKFDVLYVSIGNPAPSYGEEEIPGLVLLKNIKTNELSGITIFDFKERVINGTIDDIEIPIPIDFKNISGSLSNFNN